MLNNRRIPVVMGLLFAAFVGVIVLTTAQVAQAQAASAAGGVTIPVGAWLSDAATATWIAVGGGAGILAFLARRIPKEAYFVLRMLRLDQILDRAINKALNETPNAARNIELRFDTGVDVLNKALRNTVEFAPGLVQQFGLMGIWRRLLARVNLAPDVAIPPDLSPNLSDPLFTGLPLAGKE